MNDYILRNVVMIVCVITIMDYSYIYFMITMVQNKNNNRCDPITMISGKIGGFENSGSSFKTCIQDVQPIIYSEIKNTNDTMVENINNITTEMKKENENFLSQLKNDYESQNKYLMNHMNSLDKTKNTMNEKIKKTNDSITESLNKINDII